MARFIFTIIIWLILLTVGLLAGDRYGAPGWLSGATAPAFEAIDPYLGKDKYADDDAGAEKKTQ